MINSIWRATSRVGDREHQRRRSPSPRTRETVDRGWTRHPLKSLPIEMVVRPASCPFSDAPTGAVDYSTLFSKGAVMSDCWW